VDGGRSQLAFQNAGRVRREPKIKNRTSKTIHIEKKEWDYAILSEGKGNGGERPVNNQRQQITQTKKFSPGAFGGKG